MRKMFSWVLVYILLSGLLVFTPAVSAAAKPTIHALLVIMDESDNPRDHQKNGTNVQLLLAEVDEGQVCNLQLDIYQSSLPGLKPTRDNILRWVEDIKPQRNDVVFVYFSGHGAMQTETFLTVEGQRLYRNELVDALKAAPAWQCRLKILITESCNIKIPSTSGSGTENGESGFAMAFKAPVYRQLFVKHEGFLHLASSSEGEYTASSPAEGGFLTSKLIESIEESVASYLADPSTSTFITWDKVFKDTKKKVEEEVKANMVVPTQRSRLQSTTVRSPNAYPPEARILKVWVDHNQFEDGVKGMRIHVKFEVDNLKGGKGSVIAYFYYKNGNPLKDFNEKYRTTNGEVSGSP